MIRTSTVKALIASLLLAAPVANADMVTFEEFSHGDIVDFTDLAYPYSNVDISVINKDNGTNLAVVFDSNETFTEDPDLEGPFTNVNDDSLLDDFNPGKILIVQEDNDDCDSSSCRSPDDEGSQPAGTFIFKFKDIVELISLDFFDIEGNENGTKGKIQFFDESDTEIFAGLYATPGTGGDKTWDRLTFVGITGVKRLEVNLHGSGAIDRLVYNVVPIPSAVWLFGTALLGFIGFSRRTSV